MIQLLLIFGDWGLLVLRIIFGLILIVYGWTKIKNLKNSPQKVFLIPSLIEFIGGLFIVFGFLTQLIAFLIAIRFLVSLFNKLKQKQKMVLGFDFDLLVLAVSVALITLGGGLYALDQYLNIWIY
jgi:uncharacterized membrane protein YphA (DoxX/SURF4 family)